MTMANCNSSESVSRIPVTLRRSASLRQKGERSYHRTHHQELFPAIKENATSDAPAPLRRSSSSASLRGLSSGPGRPRREEVSDADSVRSFGSNWSTGSGCEHSHFGLNGTTWSGRSRRYMFHCSPPGDAIDSPEHYLTPSQRAARQTRKLQAMLAETRAQLDDKEQQIARLTKELVELRLLKADQPAPVAGAPLASPLVDSGHFEDGPERQREPVRPTTDEHFERRIDEMQREPVRKAAEDHFERRIDEMQRRHLDELQQLRQAHHDRLEALLNKLADLGTRLCDSAPALERAEARAAKLEAEVEELRQQLRDNQALAADQEERNRETYLQMYAKGQQAARLEQEQETPAEEEQQQPPPPTSSPAHGQTKVSVAELLQQLAVTQAELDNVKAMYRRVLESRNKQDALDPEITLQFLKSAIYYFLTDKENLHGHLNAIESILGFTESEKLNIDKIYRSAKK